uniref:Arginase n=1 Tax=Parascaris univalens TaxID=6257 RepID=A0A915AAW5_PARUN
TELVEFLPRFDKRRRTEQLIVRIIEAIYGNKFSRSCMYASSDQLPRISICFKKLEKSLL